MVDIGSINSQIDAMVAGSTVDWDKLIVAIQLKIAEAVTNGGVVTYVVNGRSVTRDISWLEKALKAAESRAPCQHGGIFVQLGEFG